jgi:plasmid stabilization system protein ParE
MDVIWAQEALERLEDIQYYLAVQEMSLSGRVVPDYNIANLRELIEGSYRIIYLIENDRILIVSVMNQSRLLSKVKGMRAAAETAVKAIKDKETKD